MAADTTTLPSLVEEFVTGLQDNKANDIASGKMCSSHLLKCFFRVTHGEISPVRATGLQGCAAQHFTQQANLALLISCGSSNLLLGRIFVTVPPHTL